MLIQIGIWIAIIGIGIDLGLAYLFIHPAGEKSEWFLFFLLGPGFLVAAGILAFALAGIK